MYITTDTIITAATLIGALGVIGGTIVAIYKFYQKPAKLEKKLENLQKTHDEDIRKINEEQCLATYGLLACLKGLKEQGCNGPVTEAINKIENRRMTWRNNYEYGTFNAVCNICTDGSRCAGIFDSSDYTSN